MYESLTDGTIIIYIDCCDCSLTSGCSKCGSIAIKAKQPFIFPNYYTDGDRCRDIKEIKFGV